MGEAGEPGSGYPINTAVEAFGDRWTRIVFRDIVFGDKRYFRELHAGSLEGIASYRPPRCIMMWPIRASRLVVPASTSSPVNAMRM